jgi:hypothetical protein
MFSGRTRYDPAAQGNQDALQTKRERWMELAKLAANEQGPEKLIALTQEIDELLEQKHKRLRPDPPE